MMADCIGDVVRITSYKLLKKVLVDCKIEMNNIGVRVYKPDKYNLIFRLWANKCCSFVQITVWKELESDPLYLLHDKEMYKIPFADPKLFNKIIKIAKDACE